MPLRPEQMSAIRVRIAELEAEISARKISESLRAELGSTGTSPVTLAEIADLIMSPAAEILLDGNYTNRHGIVGYYVQIRCGDQWCKISVSHAERGSHHITVTELDEIDRATLEPTIRIPRFRISSALKSSAAEQTTISKYVNSSSVEGIWAEFYHEHHWYMVSLSHIDVRAHLSSEDLERIADELLRQQNRPGKMRGFVPDRWRRRA